MSALLLALLANAPTVLPLPDRVDIPDGYSTVLCPSEAAARTMLADFYRVKPAPNNHTTDTERFFLGLRQSGCVQDSPRTSAITIKAVIERKEISLARGTETNLIYRGVMGPEAKPVIGIVDEGGANRFPRTELAEWKDVRTVDGWLDARRADQDSTIFYRCETPGQAAAVVKVMKGMTKVSFAKYEASLRKQAAANGCRPARESYFVTALQDRTGNECGFECFIDLTAIEAVDRAGLPVGLVFDGSLM
jgi:predicted nucleic acid-binding Zn ribbon protein